jgi:hypothetical protein
MVKILALSAIAAVFMTTAPMFAAPPVIENPGKCAAEFPNANCQNYGRGNPYTSYGGARGHWHHRHHYRH